MNTYIQVMDLGQGPRAHWKFQAAEKPEFAPPCDVIIDVTNLNPQPNEGWVYDPATGTFSDPSIPTRAEAQATQIATITGACGAAITAGFQSSALGAPYTYPSELEDQMNLNGSVTDALINQNMSGWTTQFKCADSTGTWTYRTHTSPQMQKVGQDFIAYKLAQLSRKEQLVAQVNAAADVATVQGITW